MEKPLWKSVQILVKLSRMLSLPNTIGIVKSYQVYVKIGIDHTGTKQELNHNIEEYFKGNLIRPCLKNKYCTKN